MKILRKPEVSVIMPVRNAEDHVASALQSILSQSLSNFELIVLDDGSDDRGIDIIRQSKDRRVKIVSDGKALGVAGRLNQGLDLASSPFVARMDADDVAEPTRLEKQYLFMRNNLSVGVCGTQFTLFNDTGDIWTPSMPTSPGATRAKLPFATPVGHPTAMLRGDLLRQWGLRYDEQVVAEDYDLWQRALPFFNITNLKEVLFRYRVHDKQVTSIRKKTIERVTDDIRARALDYLRIQYSEDELSLHFAVSRNAVAPETIAIERVFSWLHKVYSQSWSSIDDKMCMRKECQYYFDVIRQKYDCPTRNVKDVSAV